ncbi:class I SAM-dependent methyltransferase [Inquilinus sp. OTU3971]|uniref:class I SAM-dependent methyltransferase n=1 Tax=Inquilinus sp. OTU3971 TaxID=3043855 RepID=UPI00313EC328
MTSDPLSGTEGYAEEADRLVRQYESLSFADVHGSVFHLVPPSPARVLDIGAGTGRDAAAFAAMGHEVIAVEPTAALRLQAATLHPSSRIEWIDDGLPEIARLSDRAESFDLIMLTAVWMHLDPEQRRQAMPKVARLLRHPGVVILSLRHGPVPAGRRMFDVSAEETIALAAAEGLELALRIDKQPSQLGQPGVHWTRLAFSTPAT